MKDKKKMYLWFFFIIVLSLDIASTIYSQAKGNIELNPYHLFGKAILVSGLFILSFSNNKFIMRFQKSMIVIMIIAFSFAVMWNFITPNVKAQIIGNFDVRWLSLIDSISHKEYLIEIQNLDSASNRDFDLRTIIQDTSFPLSQVSNLWLYEWKSLAKEFPTYDTRLVERTCYDNVTDIYYDCSYYETYQNGTALKLQNDWKPSKMALLVNLDKVISDYGVINIPKFNSKAKYDDFGNVETINGTKSFKISFDVSIQKLDYGWGSFGIIGILDKNTNNFYHPWWNTIWQKKRNIQIQPSGLPDTVVNYSLLLNISYDSDMASDFSDLRFINSGETSELSYYLENYVSSSFADVYVNVNLTTTNTSIYMYYGNSSQVSTTSSGTNTFIYFCDFETDDCGFVKADTGGCSRQSTASKYGSWGLNATGVNTNDGCYKTYSINGNITIEFFAKALQTNRWFQFWDGSAGTQYIAFGWDNTANYVDADDWSYLQPIPTTYSTTVWDKITILKRKYNSTWDVDINNVRKGNARTMSATGGQEVSRISWMDGNNNPWSIYIDNIKVYNWTSTVPSYTIGSEETAPIPIYWSNNVTSIGYHAETSYFNISWVSDDTIDTVLIQINDTNYTAISLGDDVFHYNISLNEGSYYWLSYANTTAGISNKTDTWSFTVSKREAISLLDTILANVIAQQMISAIPSKQYCVDSSQLYIQKNVTFDWDENQSTMIQTQIKICEYGCDNVTLSCNPNPFEVNLQILYAIIGGLLVIGVLAFLFKRLR